MKFVPFTVSVKAPDPAVALFGTIDVVVGTGLLMLKVCAFERPPPGVGLKTVTDAVPVDETSDVEMLAVTCVEFTKVVARSLPFQRTTELDTKFVPLTVKVKADEPTTALSGLMLVVVGTRLLTVRVWPCARPPPGVGLKTVAVYVPAAVISEARIAAVTCVEFTKVVVRSLPSQRTTELDTKFVPFTVSVKPASPAFLVVGAIDVVVGTGLLTVKG